MIKRITIFLPFLLCCVQLSAQELKGRRVQADRLFDRAEYFKALDVYLKLYEDGSTNVEVPEHIADCYRLMNNYEQAEDWYARLSKTAGARVVDVFFYAEALLRNKKFDLAKDMYKRYYANETNKDLMNFKLAVCDSAAVWVKREGNYKVDFEKGISSFYSDWAPAYLVENKILFTSDRSTTDRQNSKTIYNRTGTEWLKMFSYDIKTKQTGELVFDKTGKIDLGKDYHTGPMITNKTGDTAYITVTTRAGKGKLSDVKTQYDPHVYIRRLELMIAVKKGDKWGNFTRFDFDKIDEYSVGHAALSPDGKLLYFTSDMPGGFGKTDIWFCTRGADGKWSKPVNCGKTINTNNDEAFPAIGGDGKLYFASKGLPGMGGYDIFSATGSGADWSEPVNLKYPLNSTSDDFSFTSLDGKTGYFASDRQGGQGSDDIYSFTYTGADDKLKGSSPFVAIPGDKLPSNMQAISSAAPVLLTGTVNNHTNNQPIDTVSVTLKNADGLPVETVSLTKGNKFQFKVVPGNDYTIETRRKGFYPVSNHISGRNITPAGFNEPIQLAMEPLTVGKTFVIRNIYYDLNMANIREDAVPEMDNLVAIMKENPTLRIELSSHTDARGSDYYNMLLSDARAVSAVAYLRRHGIAADRMVAKGYGETRLLNECANGVRCSEEDHQFNRRTEIKIIGGGR